jgi:hypothetical protein
LEIAEIVKSLLQAAEVIIREVARDFLTVTGNKRDGVAFI